VQEQRKGLSTEQYPEDSSKIVFSDEVLRLGNKSSFPLVDHTVEWEKIILVFAREDCENLLRSRTIFLDCPFENCRSR